MNRGVKWLIVAAVLIAAGVGLMVMPSPGEPELECVPENSPSSGFIDEDNGGCPVSVESYDEYADWDSSPKLDNIAGLLLVVAGLVVGVVGLVRGARSRRGPPG